MLFNYTAYGRLSGEISHIYAIVRGMKVIIAQGNPGTEYDNTRHNVGFAILHALASRQQAVFTHKSKFYGSVAETTISGQKTLLVLPTTFYNETGQSARAIVDFYKIDPANDLLVLHDDLALPFGTLRIRKKGSDAGNNGIKSLNSHLGPDYARIRIGIHTDLHERIGDTDFVLSRFTKEETETLVTTLQPKVIELIELFCAGTLDTTSHTLS